MKNIIAITCLLALFACGGESETEVNDGISSIVADPATEGSTTTNTTVNESSDSASDGTTTIEYVETQHDFGDVMYPSENLYTFKFKNTGTEPLVIESATASCGCTVPNKPEEPIMPGETGEMDVIFRPKEGQQGQLVTKKVTVVANTNPQRTYLEIKGNVLAPIME